MRGHGSMRSRRAAGGASETMTPHVRRIGPSHRFDLARFRAHLTLGDIRAAERALAAPMISTAQRDLLTVQLLASTGRQHEAVEAASRLRRDRRVSDVEAVLLAAR
jgi:hypothetical protein